MKTHNRILFHCLCCGRVVHAEPADAPPMCCSQRMTNAAAETVVDNDADEVPQFECGLAGKEAARTGIRIPR